MNTMLSGSCVDSPPPPPVRSGVARGDMSLQNVLDLSAATLRTVPPYGHREVLVLFAGLSTCDPGSIFASIKACQEARIR